jgi:hypothetical protein
MRRSSSSAVWALFCLVVSLGSALADGHDWHMWPVAGGGNGHEYAVALQSADWATQQALAEAAGGYLATILSQDEQGFVLGVVQAAEAASPGPTDYYWMGLLQDPQGQEPAGGWGWVTGEALGYANWASTEPNNQGGNENHGAMHRATGAWNDGRGTSALRAVIEREPQPDTTPPVLTMESPSPETLWPANHRAVEVSVSGSAVDEGSGVAQAWLEVDDEYDELDGTHDITGDLDADGNFEITLELMAWRRGNDRDGRQYTISLYAVDNAGNQAGPESVAVMVPHDQRSK